MTFNKLTFVVGAAAVKKQPSGILQCQQSLDIYHK